MATTAWSKNTESECIVGREKGCFDFIMTGRFKMAGKIPTRAHTYTHTHIHTRIHTHTQTHAQSKKEIGRNITNTCNT